LQGDFPGRLVGDRGAGSPGAGPGSGEVPIRGRAAEKRPLEAPKLRAIMCTQHTACPKSDFCHRDGTCRPCNQCEYNEDAVDKACPATCPGAPSAVDADVTPPTLHWLYVDPSSIDVRVEKPETGRSQKRVWVTLYMLISDAGVGYSKAEFIFSSSSQTQGIRGFSYAETELYSGTDRRGVHKTQFWFEDEDEGGTWKLYEMWLSDRSSNHRRYSNNDILLAGQAGMVNATIEVLAHRYVPCLQAEFIRCGERNARCMDVLKAGSWSATCACNAGYYGDGFACLPNGVNYTNTDFLGQSFPSNDEERQPVGTGYPYTGGSSSTPSTAAPTLDRGESVPPQTGAPTPSTLPHEDQPLPDASQESWSVLDTRIAMIVLVLALSAVLCLQCRRYKRLMIMLVHRRRGGNRIASDNPSPSGGRRRSDGQLSLSELRRARQEARLDTHAWVHNFAGGASNAARHEVAGSSNPLSLERQFELMQIRQIHEDARRRQGGRASRREAELEAALAASVEWGSLRGIFSGGPPQAPPPVALPEHLMLPGTASAKEEIPDGEECAVCMERRRGCTLHPCGHADLCDGCAEHIFANKGHCPMCRGKIDSVTRRPPPSRVAPPSVRQAPSRQGSWGSRVGGGPPGPLSRQSSRGSRSGSRAGSRTSGGPPGPPSRQNSGGSNGSGGGR